MNGKLKVIDILVSVILFMHYISCSVALISPGVNSTYRLNKVGTSKFQEMIFYGIAEYDYSAFFIDRGSLRLILDDLNNIYIDEEIRLRSKNMDLYEVGSRVILFELCYDLERKIDIEEEILQYQFLLNTSFPQITFGYSYPYSFVKKGDRIKKWKPLFEKEKYPNSKNILRTGFSFISCYRNLVFFKLEAERFGLNQLKIITSRGTHLSFNYDFSTEFKKYWDEPRDIGIR